MKEFVKESIELRIYGTDIKLSRPTWGQAKALRERAKSSKENSNDDLEGTEKLMVELGMPQELLNQMDVNHVKAVLELLMESKKN